MSAEADRFLHLARLAAEGGDVDWGSEAERCTDEKDRRLVRSLGFLAAVLSEHQRLQSGRRRPEPRPRPEHRADPRRRS
jgi:hypothetical protein